MKPYRFHSAAKRELDTALAYIDKQRAGYGRLLSEAIDDAIGRIRRDPSSFACYGGSELRECVLTRFPYAVYYAELDDCIWIAAIAHGSRRPGYWMKRTPEEA